MAFTPESRAPLVFYPDVASEGYPDFGFTLGLPGGANWAGVGGSPPTAVTGEGETLGKAIRFTPSVSNQSYAQTGYLATPSLNPASTDPYYIYARSKSKSGTSGNGNSVSVDFYRANGTYTGVRKTLFISCLTDMKNDNTWRVFRATVTGIPSDAAQIGGLCGDVAFAGSAEFFCDWVYFGHALDFADLGPRGDGARFESGHLPLREKTPTAYCELPNGIVESQAWAGAIAGPVDVGPMDDAAVAAYKAFVDAVRGNGVGRLQTWMQRRDDLSQHYLPRVANLNRDYGLKKRRDLWSARAQLRTVP